MQEGEVLIFSYSRKFQILLAIFPVFIAILIYLLFRDKSIYLVSLFSELKCASYLDEIRKNSKLIQFYLPNWVIYSLPDGLWSISSYSLVSIFVGIKLSFLYNIILFIIIILLELFQLFHFVNGTFDLIDILIYVIFFFLFNTIIPSKIQLTNNKKKLQ